MKLCFICTASWARRFQSAGGSVSSRGAAACSCAWGDPWRLHCELQIVTPSTVQLALAAVPQAQCLEVSLLQLGDGDQGLLQVH
eukprot:CAMPEP_0172723082 /NCGR_PEP_ID=MMETSP1074-20121228/82966_1 /TAXON_ID=2916 /ORGANISM="Ceratium fusus, Strain PA161109" /LENGTH=83 /DNA_ID=CAMNT_0013549261 /DNA_START=228 /DNA_END=478 /DNA_ORIENTATION=-